MVKTSRQFDLDRGLSKEEKFSGAQQTAASRNHYGVVTHGGPGTFNLFEADYDDVKMVTKNKKVGNRASNSVSGKPPAEDGFSVAGNTTLPSCQVEENETDSFTSSVGSESVQLRSRDQDIPMQPSLTCQEQERPHRRQNSA